jgi:hypothetical protein
MPTIFTSKPLNLFHITISFPLPYSLFTNATLPTTLNKSVPNKYQFASSACNFFSINNYVTGFTGAKFRIRGSPIPIRIRLDPPGIRQRAVSKNLNHIPAEGKLCRYSGS